MNQPADYYFVSPKMRLLTLKNLLACLVSLWCLVEASPVSYEYGVSTYQAPAPAYQPPAYGYQEPAYQPPAYGYQEPAYQPPAYGYQEPAYQAPYQEPKSYGYQEPAYQAPYQEPKSYGYQEPKSYGYQEPKSYYKPQYYETYETFVDYMPANYSKRCGVLPAVHHHSYGYKDENERQAFGEYPWQVAIMDSYYNYLCAGAIIAPRFAITSSKCVKAKAESEIRVRVGEYDLSSNHNYLEAYKNYELGVCKKHEFAPASYGSYGYGGGHGDEYSYDVAILELQEEVDFDRYPQASTLCLPEYYEKPKPVYPSYNYQPQPAYGGYGSSSSYQQSAPAPAPQSAPQELECWVGGWKESPLEKIKYQAEQKDQGYGGASASGGYGYSYKPKTYYDYYEQSRTSRKAKVHKVYEYESYSYSGYGGQQSQQQQSGGYGYGGYQKPFKTENWEAETPFHACRADQGAPVFCLVPEKPEYSYESYAPQYTPPPSYETPAYQPPSYGYQEPSYQPPSYGYQEPQYQAPSYQPPSYGYQEPQYQAPAYQPPSYGYQEPSYQAPAPAYQPPSYSAPAPRYKRAADYGYQPQPAYGYQEPQYSSPKPAYGYQEPSYQTPAYGYQEPAYQPPAYGYQEPAYPPPAYGYQEPAYQAPYQEPKSYGYQEPSYQPPSYGYQEQPYYSAPVTAIAAEKNVDDYKRAVLVGVVSYGTSCSKAGYGGYGGYGKAETKKIQVTPVKSLVDWILGVLKSANSCYASYGYNSYQPPSYSAY